LGDARKHGFAPLLGLRALGVPGGLKTTHG